MVATVPIVQFDPKSTTKLESTLYFIYSRVIDAGSGSPFFCLGFYFRLAFIKLFVLFILILVLILLIEYDRM